MKMTFLEMVQDIHNDLDLDLINSIDDTVESQQVAQIIKTTYFAMMSNRNWPHLRKTIQFIASNTTQRPTHMTVPEGMKELEFVNYNCQKEGETRLRYKAIKWLEPDSFLIKANALNTDADNTQVVNDPTGVQLVIKTDKAPEFFTSFDDKTLVFDSFDSDVENTLQVSKCQCMAYMMPNWTHSDSAIPDLPAEAFISLLEEAKSKASLKLKQSADNKAEQESVRQRNWLSRKAWKVNGGIQYPNYGRKGHKIPRDVTFAQGRNN
ncbi:head completion adaptor [Vibrio phage 468E53-1]|nr:head completion adaptor [Vibrio phage 468E53-1]CAH9015105.1 head completion adaptor [Vibrio phage 177E37-1]